MFPFVHRNTIEWIVFMHWIEYKHGVFFSFGGRNWIKNNRTSQHTQKMEVHLCDYYIGRHKIVAGYSLGNFAALHVQSVHRTDFQFTNHFLEK